MPKRATFTLEVAAKPDPRCVQAVLLANVELLAELIRNADARQQQSQPTTPAPASVQGEPK